ncbi:DUF1003 domain-containing protein [Terricaulis sp.]|uniref:DUF1003 domain-containing protein n=1 Tax=Terricaulis sp. TaxID=2768686 RepID=UPI00378364DF
MTITDLLPKLRARSAERLETLVAQQSSGASFGDRVSDKVTSAVGSWPFILIQSALLIGWIIFNAASPGRVDPYPFILLNLMLSFQAAYTAPIIMMSQNRQAEIDRRRAIEDFEVNCKAEVEIETLHQKIDLLREQEIAALTAAVDRLTRMLEAKQG